ncbi:MAG: 50S ribosomal protein L28 [Alphaproteobacteria bacterium]|nr:50S ribosomal protein L28 [Alphaproteobacteria bacterium]
MARRCSVSGKGVQVGNNVSHANNKTKRRYLPNLQQISLTSDALGDQVRMRITTRAIKTIEKNGGIDAWILGTANSRLPADLKRLKRRIAKRADAKAAAAKAA